MLRITTCDGPGATRLVVEGKIAGACVSELEKCWRQTSAAKSTESLLVDLSGVTFVDAAGKQLLADMHEQGTKFAAAGLLARCLKAEIENG